MTIRVDGWDTHTWPSPSLAGYCDAGWMFLPVRVIPARDYTCLYCCVLLWAGRWASLLLAQRRRAETLMRAGRTATLFSGQGSTRWSSVRRTAPVGGLRGLMLLLSLGQSRDGGPALACRVG